MNPEPLCKNSSDIAYIKGKIGNCNCGLEPEVLCRENEFIGKYYEVLCRKCLYRVPSQSVDGAIAMTLHVLGRHSEVE